MLSAPQSAHRYSYAQNNPYRYTDPSGHFVQTVVEDPGEVASLLVQLTPPGIAYSAFTVITGWDPLAGRDLTEEERNLGLLLIVGGAAAALLVDVAGAAFRALARAGAKLSRGIDRLDGAFGRLASRIGGSAERLGARIAGLEGKVRAPRLPSTVDDASALRLPQDAAAGSAAPRALPLYRPVGLSKSQNAYAQERIAALQEQGAIDIRVNQQQVDIHGDRVGINRPDLQYTLNGQRRYEEFDGFASERGLEHQARIYANDPKGDVTLVWVN